MRLFGFDITRKKAERTHFLGELVRLQLKPDDVCVLMVRSAVSAEQAAKFAEHWRIKFGDIPLMVLDNGMRLGVLSPPQAEQARMHITDSEAVDKALEGN